MAKLVWGRLAQFAGKRGTCFPSQGRLARELCTTPRHIRRVLDELVSKGFLEREAPSKKERGQHKTTRYYFLLHPILDSGRSGLQLEEDQPRDIEVHTLGTDMSLTSGRMCPYPRDEKVPNLGAMMSYKEIQLEDSQTKNHENDTRMEIPHKVTLADVTCCGGHKLYAHISDMQRRYIDLKVSYQLSKGKLDLPNAYRNKLERLARSNNLDMSDMTDLEAVMHQEQQRQEKRACSQETTKKLASLVEQYGAQYVCMTYIWHATYPNTFKLEVREALGKSSPADIDAFLIEQHNEDWNNAMSFDWGAYFENQKQRRIETYRERIATYLSSHPEWTVETVCNECFITSENTFPFHEIGTEMELVVKAIERLFPIEYQQARIKWHEFGRTRWTRKTTG